MTQKRYPHLTTNDLIQISISNLKKGQAWSQDGFDELSFFREWHENLKRNPWELHAFFPKMIEAGVNISVFVAPMEEHRNAFKRFEDPKYRFGYELPQLLISEAPTEHTAAQLDDALTLIVRLHGLEVLETKALEYAFMHLLYLTLVSSEIENARLGFCPVLSQRALDECHLGNAKLEKLKEMSFWEKVELELRLNQPAFKLDHLLLIWSAFGQNASTQRLPQSSKSPGIWLFGTLPPSFVPLETFQDNQDANGQMKFEPLVEVPLREAQLAKRLLDLSPGLLESDGDDLTSVVGAGFFDRRKNCFKQMGEWWLVCYDGLYSIVGNSMGMNHLRFLISNPNRDFHALELDSLVRGEPGTAISDFYKEMTSPQLADQNLSLTSMERPAPLIDEKSHRAVLSRINSLRQQFEVDNFANPEQRLEAQEELRLVEEYILKATTPDGKVRTDSVSNEKARSNITQRIRKDIARLGKSHRQLERHLSTSVKTGLVFSYRPSDQITWHV